MTKVSSDTQLGFTVTTTTSSTTTTTTTTTTNHKGPRWAHKRAQSKGEMTSVSMEMEEPMIKVRVAEDSDDVMETPPPRTRKWTSINKMTAKERVFHYIDKNNVKELRKLRNEFRVLKFILKEPPSETPLHRATKKGFIDCLKVLLDGKDEEEDLEIPDSEGQTALLTAVINIQPEALKLLVYEGANVNARDNYRRGALHILIQELSKASRSEEEKRHLLDMADVLLSSELDLEPHATIDGFTNVTPLGLAAAKIRQGNTNGLLELCKKLLNAGASLTEKVGNESVEEVLTRKRCLIEEIQQQKYTKLPQRPMAAHVVDLVAMDVSSNNVINVLQGKSWERSEAVNSRLGSHSLLFLAVDKGNVSLLKTLLENGASPWEQEGNHDLPLHHAAKENNVEIFQLLIKEMKGKKSYLYLWEHNASVFKVCVESAKKGDDGCFRCLLEESDHEAIAKSLNEEDMKENVLPILVFYLKHLINTDTDMVFSIIMPSTLEQAMDCCITFPDIGDTINIDYRFLMSQSESGCVNELELPIRWCHNQQNFQIMKHPLMQTLLNAKRHKAMPLYITYVISHFILTVLFTALSCYIYYRNKVCFIFMLVMIVKEILQWFYRKDLGQGSLMSKRWKQFKDIRNFFTYCYRLLKGSLKIILMAFLLGLTFIGEELVIWSIVFFWYDFVNVLGRFPQLYKYATALHIVTKTFLKLIFVYGGLIAAFACSFSIIFSSSGHPSISDFGNTTLKTLVMSLGEFEYGDTMANVQGIPAKLLFIGFLFFIVLVVMNVMNSLAVADIENCVKGAGLNKLKVQLETLYTLECFCTSMSCLCSKLNCTCVFEPRSQSLETSVCLSDGLLQLKSNTRDKTIATLDEDTMTCLRNYRTHHMQQKQIETAAKDLATYHPEVVRTLAATLCSNQS